MAVLLRLLRFLLRIPGPKINKVQAVTIAIEEGNKQGWTVTTPVARERLRTWFVRLEPQVLNSAWVEVDAQTGAIVRSGDPPR